MGSDAAEGVIGFVEILRYLELAWEAHDKHARTPEDRVRRHDGETPHIVHPAWAAFTIMQEPSLSLELRWLGFRVLILHDVLEDTTLELPDWVPEEVRTCVELMCFESTEAEMEEVWERPKEIRLFKTYDKASNLLDGTWMDSREPGYQERYESYALRLADDVQANFGELNICRIIRAVRQEA